MADFYSQFKAGADEAALALSETVRELLNRLPKVEKRIEDEKARLASIEERIAILKSLAHESLTSDQNSYEKYRTSLKKLNAEFETSTEIIKTLTDEILPKREAEYLDAKTVLRESLDNYMQWCKCLVNEQICDIFREVIGQRQNFLDCFSRIYADYDFVFCCRESDRIGLWDRFEVADWRRRLGMPSLTAPKPAPVAAVEPQTTPETPVTTPEAEFVQSVEPAMPIVGDSEAVETTPGTTLLTGETAQ